MRDLRTQFVELQNIVLSLGQDKIFLVPLLGLIAPMKPSLLVHISYNLRLFVAIIAYNRPL